MTPTELLAPAKLNLCLYLGPRRKDGLHELASIFEPLSLHDRLTVTEAERDEVICPGVEGLNLAAEAMRLLRSEGWQTPPLRIEIAKRIPVQAGLGGGSADAAAVLRLAVGEVDDLAGLAIILGADVPSQLDPVPCLVEGVGQKLTSLPVPAAHWVVLLPFAEGLPTAGVFNEADRLGLGRPQEELDEMSGRLWAVASGGVSPLAYPGLLVNDLEPAAITLKPEIGIRKQQLQDAGASFAGMTGTGPTVFGIFAEKAEADAAADSLGEGAMVCEAGSGL
ncbi:MAG: 4-(cytidine 5'-diphospho)-2-C-methyl-D-erythritol kinase [Solirubrobacterales bacterium]